MTLHHIFWQCAFPLILLLGGILIGCLIRDVQMRGVAKK